MPRNARREVEKSPRRSTKPCRSRLAGFWPPAQSCALCLGRPGPVSALGRSPTNGLLRDPWPSFACCHVSALPLAGLCFSLSSGGACSGSADCWTTRPHRLQAHRCLAPALCGSLNASGPQLDPRGLAPRQACRWMTAQLFLYMRRARPVASTSSIANFHRRRCDCRCRSF